MKHIVRTALLGGALVVASLASAAPASAACWNNPEGLALRIPTACVFYDNCDADICIGKPSI
jgi:hypothetical protein